jgi:hypothetical protein
MKRFWMQEILSESTELCGNVALMDCEALLYQGGMIAA